jgi:hypothetical protein
LTLLEFTLGEVLNNPFNSDKPALQGFACLPVGREVLPAGLINATIRFIVKRSSFFSYLIAHNYPSNFFSCPIL